MNNPFGRQYHCGYNNDSYSSSDVYFREQYPSFFLKPNLKIVYDPVKERSEYISECLDRRWEPLSQGGYQTPKGEAVLPSKFYPLRHFINIVVENQGSEPAVNCEAKLRMLSSINGCKTSNTQVKKLVWENGEDKMTIGAKHGREKFQVVFSQQRLTVQQENKISNVHCGILNQNTRFRSWFATLTALRSTEYADADGLCLGNFEVHVEVVSERGHRRCKDLIIKVGDTWQNLAADMLDCRCSFGKSKSLPRRILSHLIHR